MNFATRIGALLVLSMSWQGQAQTVSIRDLDRTRSVGWAEVDGSWTWAPEVIRVRLSVAEEFRGRLPIRGFYFDGDKKLLRKLDGVPSVKMKGNETQSLPEVFEAGRQYEVGYPIASAIANGPGRWKTFIVEVGGGSGIARASYPARVDFAEFDTKSDTKAAQQGAVETVLAVKGVTRFRNGLRAWVRDSWMTGLNTLRVRLRIDSAATAGGFFAKAYFYDKDKHKVLKYDEPTEAEVTYGKQFVSLPTVWEDKKDFEVYFAIPEDKDRGPNSWRTAIVVFGNKHAVVAGTFPHTVVDIDEFSFPEKPAVKAMVAEGEAGRGRNRPEERGCCATPCERTFVLPLRVGSSPREKFRDSELQLHHRFVLLIGAGRVERDIGSPLARLDESLIEKIALHFLAADVGQHGAVHNHARRKRLSAELLHFEAELRALDDVLFRVRNAVLGEDGADSVAPAAGGLQVGSDFRFTHGR
jgi:hypothetical protein